MQIILAQTPKMRGQQLTELISPFSIFSLEVIEIGLPLIPYYFTTREASYRDDHPYLSLWACPSLGPAHKQFDIKVFPDLPYLAASYSYKESEVVCQSLSSDQGW